MEHFLRLSSTEELRWLLGGRTLCAPDRKSRIFAELLIALTKLHSVSVDTKCCADLGPALGIVMGTVFDCRSFIYLFILKIIYAIYFHRLPSACHAGGLKSVNFAGRTLVSVLMAPHNWLSCTNGRHATYQ